MTRLFVLAAFLFSVTPVIAQDMDEPYRSGPDQIRAAVSPLPADLQYSATVWGYDREGNFMRIQSGFNSMVCFADRPGNDRFHVACFHDSMLEYMQRGRQLSAEGKARDEVMDIRDKEAKDGTLAVPKEPALLYSLSGGLDVYDYESHEVKGASPLYAVYMPFATAESTGLATSPVTEGAPWIMHAGRSNAHIMIVTGRMVGETEPVADDSDDSDNGGDEN